MINISHLKWTKNVKDLSGQPWAYHQFATGQLFKLAWKNNLENANKPEKGDLILLRQRGFVSHLVQVLNRQAERENWQGDFDTYRIVEVFWAIENWDNPPTVARADELFSYPAVLSYQGGDVMRLQNLPSFQERWQEHGGIEAFQSRVKNNLIL